MSFPTLYQLGGKPVCRPPPQLNLFSQNRFQTLKRILLFSRTSLYGKWNVDIMSPSLKQIKQKSRDPIVQLQLLLLLIFVLYFCGQTAIEHLWMNQIQMENQQWMTQLTWYKKIFYFSLQALILIIITIILIRIIRIQNSYKILAREREALMAEKERALAASRESNDMLEKIISNLPVGIVFVGQDKKIMQLNAEAERILGYDVGEGDSCLKGLDCHTHYCNIPGGQCPIYDLKKTNVLLEERLLLKKNHRFVSVLKSVIPILLNEQEVLLEAFMDMSSVKAAEHAILEAKQTAESANQAKSRFLTNMGHEIRTPLNAILGFSDILLARETSGEVRANLTIIAESGRQLLGMINNILDYSKLEAGEMTLDNQPFALFTLLHQTPELFSDQAQKKSLTMEVMIDKTVPRYVMGDEIKIRQIFMNLVGNAVKFSDHGKILIHAHAAGSGIVFKIHDSGVGIPREKLEAVFHPFEQADGAMNRKYGGAGLGLSLTLSLVKLMGGDLSVTSHPGEGSVFILSLPLAAVPAEKMEKKSITSHGRMPGAGISPGRALKGLVVEDHPGNLKLTETMLQHMGIHSQGAINGQIALSLMEKTLYDFVLMDVHMPVMDGLETLKEIRQQPLWQNIPVLVVTGYVTEELREEFMAVGFDDFISKPFTRELLYEKLSILFPNLNQIDSQILSPPSVCAQERLPNYPETVVEDEKELAEMALEMVEINMNLFNPDEIEGVARMVLDSSGDARLQDMAQRLIHIAQDFDEEGLDAMFMELEILLGPSQKTQIV